MLNYHTTGSYLVCNKMGLDNIRLFVDIRELCWDTLVQVILLKLDAVLAPNGR